jgi:hypothetical protein
MAKSGPLTSAQAEVFALGLYHIASTDGVDAREIHMIYELLQKFGCAELAARLTEERFDLKRAAHVLDAPARRLFLKTAFYLISADGKISEQERRAIERVALYLNLMNDVPAIEAEVAKAPGRKGLLEFIEAATSAPKGQSKGQSLEDFF